MKFDAVDLSPWIDDSPIIVIEAKDFADACKKTEGTGIYIIGPHDEEEK